MSEPARQKSSSCGGGGNNCIELSADHHHMRIRDFLREIKSRRYDQSPRAVRAGPKRTGAVSRA
nr:DUF397 domain-containing protein [Streptomyces sp. RPT161]